MVETVPEEQNTQREYFEVEYAPPQQMEEASDASSSSDEKSDSEGNAAVFAASGQICRIDGNVYLGINTVSDPENSVYANLDWEHVNNDPTHKQHHDMFTCFFDAETCELMDPDGLHPFCLASKLNADNYPSFREILRMDKETCNKWFNAMDKELQDVFKSGTFEFVSQDKVLKTGQGNCSNNMGVLEETSSFWRSLLIQGMCMRSWRSSMQKLFK